MKQTPPIDDHLITFRFPQIEEVTLANGLTVLVIEHPKIPKVYLRLGTLFGERYDPEGQEGSAELLANLIKKGTRQQAYTDIVETVDTMGGELEAIARRDFFYLYGEFLSEYAEQSIALLADVVQFPLFPEEELEKERQKMLADLENEKSSPAYLANRKFNQVLFTPHPYARYKTATSLQRIGRETLLNLHQQFLVPNNSYLVIAGDLSTQKAIALAEKYFSTWENRPLPALAVPSPQPPPERSVFLVDRPQSEQSNILIGNLLFHRTHPDYEKVLVMNKILGGGASGRLFLYLREEKGYTYGAYSSIRTYREHGAFSANAEVRTEVTTDAITAFFEQFHRIRQQPVSEDDLKNAKRYLIGVFPLQNETPSSIAALALQQKLYGLPPDYWNQYLKRIDAVTRDDVQQMAQKYLLPERMAIIVVGDAQHISQPLTALGTVQVYDLEDRPKSSIS